MSNFSFLPPDLYTAFVEPGDVAWRDFFLRQRNFLQDMVKTPPGVVLTKGYIPIATNDGLLIDSEFTAADITGDSGGGMMPYLIDADETFTVPIKKQGLFSMTINVLGTIVVNGYLVQVTT